MLTIGLSGASLRRQRVRPPHGGDEAAIDTAAVDEEAAAVYNKPPGPVGWFAPPRRLVPPRLEEEPEMRCWPTTGTAPKPRCRLPLRMPHARMMLRGAMAARAAHAEVLEAAAGGGTRALPSFDGSPLDSSCRGSMQTDDDEPGRRER